MARTLKPKLEKTETTREVAVPTGVVPGLKPAPRADGARLRNETTRATLEQPDGTARVLVERDLPRDCSRGFVNAAFVPELHGASILVGTGDGLELVTDGGEVVARLALSAPVWGVHALGERTAVLRATGLLLFVALDERDAGAPLVLLGKLTIPKEANVTIHGGHVYFSRDLSLVGKRWWRVDGVPDLLEWALPREG
jgi:hypothetical protein